MNDPRDDDRYAWRRPAAAPPPVPSQGAPRLPPREPVRGEKVWSQGELLVMRKGALLPVDRCFRCDQPPAERQKLSIYWHPPSYYFLIVLGLLPYALVALAGRELAEVEVPLCARHADRRRNRFLAALAGLGAVVLSSVVVAAVVASFGVAEVLVPIIAVVSVAGAVAMVFVAWWAFIWPATPQKIDPHHVWLKHAGPDYLARLPAAPPQVPRP